MIATLIKPTAGSISVGGFDAVKDPQEVRRRLGFLTGTTKLYDRLTPNELVKYYADLHQMDRAVFERRRDELFELLDMKGFARQRIGKLSGGMRQKVSIVRTMIHDPDIIVFDEPTVGLDVITSKNIIELIRNCRNQGKTVIFSTHIMGEVNLLSDDLAIIHKGRLAFNGTKDEFVGQMQSGSLEEEFIRQVEGVAS
jgi:sodium transport system ATP-binding protein